MNSAPAEALRLAPFMRLSDDEAAVLAFHRSLLDDVLITAVDGLYLNIRKDESALGRFSDEPQLVRARDAQISHWRMMLQGVFDDAYEARAKRIGAAHARIKLDHRIYMGGCTHVLDELVRQVFRAAAQGAIDAVTAEKLSTALVKCASFDMGVVLTAYLEELRAESAAKSRLLTDLSHDLRTPLNAVIGYAELLLEDLPKDFSLTADVTAILSGAQRLLHLLDSLLALAKIEGDEGELSQETFDPLPFARSSLKIVDEEARSRRIELKFEPDTDVGALTTDSDKLRQCLDAITANTVRFLHDGALTLRVRRRVALAGDWIDFAFRSSGADAERVIKLFSDPVREDYVKPERADTVLSLAVVRGLVRRLGGVLQAEVVGAEGASTIVMSLPTARPTTKN